MPKGETKVRDSRDPALIAQRFWSRVEFPWKGRWDPPTNPALGRCWEWQGARDKDGYGQFRFMGGQTKAHRTVMVLLGYNLGPQIAHHCDNPPCVRPSHLFPATARENNADKMAKGRHRYVSNLPRVIAARQRKEVV